ncbi:MAG TPA: T9SS type A sorting domain-containing protein, partial [Saprospiraceae bacterium]|nr:T9SS type A sorting domain-containing protein [Saprospiraceae bacterium]
LGYSKLEQHEWNHAQTHMSSSVAADQVPLKGSPVFLSPQSSASTEGASKTLLQALLVPNPSDSRGTQLVFRLSESGAVSAQIFDAQGRPVQQPVSEVLMSAGVSQLPIDVSSLPAGTYFLRLSTPEGVQNLPLVRM